MNEIVYCGRIEVIPIPVYDGRIAEDDGYFIGSSKFEVYYKLLKQLYNIVKNMTEVKDEN